MTPRLLDRHPSFSLLCETLTREPLFIPEYSEEDLATFRDGNPSWTTGLGEDAAGRMTETMKAATVSKEAVVAQVKEALGKRFPEGSEPTRESILKTVKAGLVASALETRSVRMDATTFDILAKWGSQLFLLSESPYVHGVTGALMIWLDLRRTSSETRRKPTLHGVACRNTVTPWWRPRGPRTGNSRTHSRRSLQANSVRYPHLEIFRVRALQLSESGSITRLSIR